MQVEVGEINEFSRCLRNKGRRFAQAPHRGIHRRWTDHRLLLRVHQRDHHRQRKLLSVQSARIRRHHRPPNPNLNLPARQTRRILRTRRPLPAAPHLLHRLHLRRPRPYPARRDREFPPQRARAPTKSASSSNSSTRKTGAPGPTPAPAAAAATAAPSTPSPPSGSRSRSAQVTEASRQASQRPPRIPKPRRRLQPVPKVQP